VLLIEADPALRAVLIDRLEAAGMNVRTAATAAGVRTALAEGWPEALVVGAASRRQRAVVGAICSAETVPVVVLGERDEALADVVRAVG
jgi:DNA-binding response OmpR family regulator